MVGNGNNRNEQAKPRNIKLPKQIDNVDNSISIMLGRLQQYSNMLHIQENGPLTPTRTQFIVLLTISKEGRINQKTISELSKIDSSTVTEVIKNLVKNKWITKRRSSVDRREFLIQITEAGKNVLASSKQNIANADRALITLLPVSMRAAFRDCLRKLNDQIIKEKNNKYDEAAE